jgi:hypothetical protein
MCTWFDEETELNTRSCQGGASDDSRSIVGEGYNEHGDRAVGAGLASVLFTNCSVPLQWAIGERRER